ncbi:cyclic nucleotide-binding domain-containing protein [Roseovarius sp. M141]|uniref:cyclic nucleotide-binding domain-containing protein n=1 Tax=Roseovarius sp. M141 TaxID=2583806 RepID=UPI0020CD1795|nr:cyclic nucleotide-binding domain-containing protein [Roseovarius sp. M141]MCQ0093146.1 cyclic nucleotide-binding domain-containing protein [Roseovarius sp. M141]
MKESDIPDIRSLPLLCGMADENFDLLTRAAYIQNFPPQIELISEGEPSDFLHIVVDGTVELFAKWNDRETTMATVRSPGTFIVAASIMQSPYLMSARTLEKSRLVLLPSEDVRTLFTIDKGFAQAVVTELSRCYRTLVKNTKNLKLRTAIERLANYLIRKQANTGSAQSFMLDIEKRLLASYLGMTPENLSRAIKALQPYGVSFDGAQVKISDAKALLGLAKPSPLIDNAAL